MHFVFRKGWYCQFLEADRKTPLPRALTFADEHKAFSPDGKRLATVSWDGTVQVHALDIRELLKLARSRVTRPLTAEECQRYLQSATCPPLP